MQGYYYVYVNKKGDLIIKLLSYDNYLNVGDYNNYNHKLIYKVKLIYGKPYQIKKEKNNEITFQKTDVIKRKMIKL